MFPPNLKQIDQKTWLRGPKNRQNGRYDAITSRRFYVMTFFFTWYDAAIPSACFYQIWSKSVKKHAHNREKRIFEPSHCQPTSKFENRAPSLHAPLPYLWCVQIWRWSVEKQKSLSIYKFVVVVVVVVVINCLIIYNTPWRRRSRFSAPGGGGWF